MTTSEFFAKNPTACAEARTWAEQYQTMAEAWDNCRNPDWMFWALRAEKYNDRRKLRLCACAFVRRTPAGNDRMVWDLLTDERSRNAVEVAELYADDKATDEQLNAAQAAAAQAAAAVAAGVTGVADARASWAAAGASWAAAGAAWAANRAAGAASAAARVADGAAAAAAAQSNIIREIISNPFREELPAMTYNMRKKLWDIAFALAFAGAIIAAADVIHAMGGF